MNLRVWQNSKPTFDTSVLRRVIRVIATGFSFAVFGFSCVVLFLIVFPLMWPFTRFSVQPSVYYRRVIAASFRFFGRMMRFLGLITFELSGFDQVPDRCLVVANHPSLIDVVFLLGWITDANCIVKGALYRNPVTVGPISAAGYVNTDSPTLIETCKASLEAGHPLLIFPEGTRTTPLEEVHLRRGAANIALMVDVPILPVTIELAPVTLVKGEKWWQVPDVTPHYRVKCHPLWHPTTKKGISPHRSKQARELTRNLETFYNEFLS